MHVIGHHAPTVQPIAIPIEVLQRTGNNLRMLAQQAGTATCVELLIEPKFERSIETRPLLGRGRKPHQVLALSIEVNRNVRWESVGERERYEIDGGSERSVEV